MVSLSRYLQAPMRPGITLATIVRNESRCLKRCLESVRNAVERIVLVDTGSTDGTRDIGKKLGAEVIQIEWPDAFDEARNVALDAVDTEWTLWLDADEWLVDGAGAALRRAILEDRALGFTLIRQDLYPDGRHGEQQLFRLWRTHPKLRFEGVIHEHLRDEDLMGAWPERKLFQSDIAFWHDGFRAEAAPEKLRRNAALLRKELDQRPGQIYYRIELGNTLRQLGDPAGEAVFEDLARDLIARQEDDEAPSNTVDQFLWMYLGSLPEAKLNTAQTDALIRLARGWFPESPVALTAAAQAEIRRGNLQGALPILLDIEKLAATGQYGRATTVHPSLLREGLYTNLGLVAHQLGRRDVAARAYKRLLEFDPNNPVARQNLPLL